MTPNLTPNRPLAILKAAAKWLVVDLFPPALIGAFFGYAAAVYQSDRATDAKRAFLVQTLRAELSAIAPAVPAYDPKMAFIRDPIELASIPLMVSGAIFEYPSDTQVMRAVLNLNIALSLYNEYVRITNAAQSSAVIPNDAHRKMYEDVSIRHERVRRAKEDFLRVTAATDSATPLLRP